jgi:hypothetical protein
LNHHLPQSWPMNVALWHRARSYHFSDSLIGSRWATKNIVGKVGVAHTHFIHDQYCSLLPSNREPVPHQSLVSTLWLSCKTKLWQKTKDLHTSKNPKKTLFSSAKGSLFHSPAKPGWFLVKCLWQPKISFFSPENVRNEKLTS